MLSGTEKSCLLSQPSACPPFPVDFLFCNTSAKIFWVYAIAVTALLLVCLPSLFLTPFAFFPLLFLFHKLLLEHIFLLYHFASLSNLSSPSLCRILWGLCFLLGVPVPAPHLVPWCWAGVVPGTVTCVTAPLLLHHCLSSPVVSLPLTPDLVFLLPKKLGSHTLPNTPGRGSLAVLSWSCSCQEPDLRRAQALQAGNWPLQLLLSGIIIPGRNSFAWGIFCKEFVVITGPKYAEENFIFF